MTGLDSFLATYGLAIVLVGSFLEGESVVVMAGFLAHQGILDPVAVGVAAFCGSFASDQLLFYVGRRFNGHRFVVRATQKRAFAVALRMIEKHPIKFILSMRFLYGLRVASPIAIGFTDVPAGRYLFFNTIAAVIWASLFTLLGYLFGQTIEHFLGQLHAAGKIVLIALGIGAVVTVLIYLLTRHRAKHPAA